MVAIGFGLAWAGYATFMWGYCLVRDYNVTVPDLFKAVWPGTSGTAKGTQAALVPPSAVRQPSSTPQPRGQ